jgi:hypothetical protein
MDYNQEEENPFAVSRLTDPCLTKNFADKIKSDLKKIDQLINEISPNITTKVTKQDLTKIKQSQRILHATLKNLQQGLDQHKTFEKEYAQCTVDRLKKVMLNVNGKRMPLKVVPYKSGREKSQYYKDMEKKKKEAAEKGRLKKKAKLNSTLKGRNKSSK